MAEHKEFDMTNVTAIEQTIGDRVRILREQLHLSQGKFGSILYRQGFRTGQPAIFAIENGRRAIRLSEAYALCVALDVDLSTLTEGVGLDRRPSVAAAIGILEEYERTGSLSA